MSDDTLRMWMADLSKRIERMDKAIRSELTSIRTLLHSPKDCPIKISFDGYDDRIEKIEKRLDERNKSSRKRSWDIARELVKSVLTVAGAVFISWLLLATGLR